MSKRTPFEARLVRADNGCLLWTGGLKDDGYGVVWLGYTTALRLDSTLGGLVEYRKQNFGRAHVIAYEKKHGPVPDGMELEHTCHTKDLSCAGGPSCLHRACCDADHLIAVTHTENMALLAAHRRAREEQYA